MKRLLIFRAGRPVQNCRTLSSLNQSIFDPSKFEGTRLPFLKAQPLPGYCYTSQDWFERELETVFKSSWVLIGRADEIPNPGEYITLKAPGIGPIFVSRSKDQSINGFVNICRHRGALLLPNEKGKLKGGGVVCPYHAWTYDSSSGKLKGAPKMNDCFDKSKFPLHSIRLEEMGGFLFASSNSIPSSEKVSLKDSLGNLPELIFNHWPLDELVTVGRAEYTINCNWKFLLENTSETYHTPYVHKSTLGAMDSNPGSEVLPKQPQGDWTTVFVPGDRSVVPLHGEEAPFPNFQNKTFFVSMFPSLQINVTHDCVWWMRMLPLAVDKTQVTQGFLFPKSTIQNDEMFQEKLKPYLNRWKLAVVEDNEISENQQLGASSPEASDPGSGAYSELEKGVHELHNYLLDRMVGPYKK
jgi:phenylpropionate dioxygenase-like ring-hydroxylating dioxygenase large terminal subunit